MTVTKVPAALLVEDFDLYPRNQVSDVHVNELMRAAASGVELPPIIADRATHRIVDGIHRNRMFKKLLGPDVIVSVEYRDYPDEAALYLDAVVLNSSHGRRLDRHDQTRIVLKLQELKVDAKVIASALHVPEQEVRTLAVRVVYDTAGMAVPRKHGLEHMTGLTLTKEQVDVMRSVRSADVGRICLELTRLLEQELVDYTDVQTQQRLQALATAVTAALKRFRVARKVKKPAQEALPA